MKRYIPNIITCIRILIIPLLIYLGIKDYIYPVIILTIVISLTDTLDGYLARKWEVVSNLGTKLDTIADKMFSISLLIVLFHYNHYFLYLLVLEAIIGIVKLYFYFRSGLVSSSLAGKLKTWFLFTSIVIGFIAYLFKWFNIITSIFIVITFILQIVTLIGYIAEYFRIKTKKKTLISDYEHFYSIVKPILTHEEYQKRKLFMHHVDESVYDHCLRVAFDSYKIAKKFKLDYRACAIGGLLHDFYDKPWQNKIGTTKFLQKHGFVHAAQAKMNSRRVFPEYMNPLIEDMIEKHMFPLNRRPPKYKESWLITLVDKADSMDFIMHPRTMRRLLFGKKRIEIQEMLKEDE